jgi:hypothetical protein
VARPIRYRYKAEILEIHRADLYRVSMDLGFHTYRMGIIKLAGVVCPTADDSPESIKYAKDNLLVDDPLVEVQTFRQMKNVWLATIWLNGSSFNSQLLETPYGEYYR